MNPSIDPQAADGFGALGARLMALWPVQTEDHALLFLDSNGLIVGANPVAERLLGYGWEELVQQPLRIIFELDDIGRGLDRHEVEVASRLGRSEDDRWHVRKDGSRFWASGMLTAIVDGQGKRVGFVKILRDRTDLRAQISAFENRLEVAEEALVARRRFMRTLAHELSNPLTALRGAQVLLKRALGATPSARFVEIAENQLVVMSRLVDELREATKIDSGAMTLDLTQVDLQGAIRSAVERHAAGSDSRGRVVSVVLPEVTISVRADAARLEQIMRNLLDNAFRYSPQGGRVWVTATVERPMAVVRVRDEGDGVSPDSLQRLFDMFTRGAPAIESASEGLGIGLAVVKNLVQLHKGTIEVQTAGPGYGSEFTVNLPLWQPNAQTARPLMAVVPKQAGGSGG